jgi:hypothetical protein
VLGVAIGRQRQTNTAPCAGRPVLLSLVTEAYPTFNYDLAVWAQPMVE